MSNEISRKSNAPRPATILSGSGNSHHRKTTPKPANWDVWRFVPKCALWEAICLTLDIEPDSVKEEILRWITRYIDTPAGMSQDFVNRLKIARSNLSANGPIFLLQLNQGISGSPHADVSLPNMGAFAMRTGWLIPKALMDLAEAQAAKIASTSSAIVNSKHALKNRAQELDAEIASAKKNATDANDHHSVWNALRDIALEQYGSFNGEMTPNALGYTNAKGEYKTFKKSSLRKRMTRAVC